MHIIRSKLLTSFVVLGLFLATGAYGAAAFAAEKDATVKPAASEPTDPSENVNAGPQLPLPRFVTLGADEVNVRTGPGLKYPIKFIIRKTGLPVEVKGEHEVWRRIEDSDRDGGWVHKSMLSGRRGVIVQGQVQSLLKKPDEAAPPVAKLEPGVVAELEACKADWCKLEVQSYTGWVKRAHLWGVYPQETVEE
jgi:SH3-like domain-containing protein